MSQIYTGTLPANTSSIEIGVTPNNFYAIAASAVVLVEGKSTVGGTDDWIPLYVPPALVSSSDDGARAGSFKATTPVVRVTPRGTAARVNLFSGGAGLPDLTAGGAMPVDGSAVAQPVVGYQTNPSASVTRPADTIAYTANDLVANNVTAGSVTVPSLSVARVATGGVMIRRVKLHKSTNVTANAAFRIHFFRAAPTVTNGDNGAFLPSGTANYLGACDVTVTQALSDGSAGFGTPNAGSEISVRLASGTAIFFLIEALAAYAPGSAEVFTVTLDNLQN